MLRVLLCFLALCMAAIAADTPVSTSTQERRAAVNFVRDVVTAEIAYKNKNGKFATTEELVASEMLKRAPRQYDLSNDQPIPNFRFRLIVPAQGDRFQLALVGTDGWSVFSDEHALIYVGEPLK